MSHTAPDGSWLGVLSTLYALQDLGELAARLGSIVSFDRRGNVFWLDNFEDGAGKWTLAYSGTGAGTALVATTAHSGAYSLKLTTGDAEDDYAYAEKRMSYPGLEGLGLECSFASDAVTPTVTLQLLVRGAATSYWASVRYSWERDVVEYLDENNAWQTLASSVDLANTRYVFHAMKLVADFSTGKYIRCILGDVEYDMSAYDLRSVSVAQTPILHGRITVETEAGANEPVFIDNVIFTRNEE